MADQNFQEQYLGIIIETYEKQVMKLGDPKGYKVLTLKTATDLKAVTRATKDSINSFPGSKYDLEKNPEEADKKSEKKIDINLLKKMNIPLAPEQLNNYLERCFGCDLRLQWEWQLLPPDLTLNPLTDMFNSMLANLEALKDVFNTKKKLEQICSIPKLFDGIPCPQDLLNIVFALKLILNKYINFGLKLKIDWFVLLGPIISAIVNLLSYIVNLIFDTMTAPLDCSLATMNSGLEMLRLLEGAIYGTGASKPSIKPSSSATSNLIETDNSSTSSTGVSAQTSSSTGTEGAGIDTQAMASLNTSKSGDLALASGITTGVSIGGFLSNIGADKPSFTDLSFPEQFLTSIVEAKDYVSFYKLKILESVNALSGLVKGSKLVDMQNMSALIMIAELISFVLQLLATDFKTLCSDQNKTKLNSFVKSYISQTDDSLVIEITTSDTGDTIANITELEGITQSLTLKPCSSANTSQDIKQVENILAEIERLTRNG